MANFARQDWLVTLYLGFLLGAVLLGQGPRRHTAIAWLCADLVICVGCIAVARSGLAHAWGPFATVGSRLLYRATLLGALLATFFQLHYILPSARTVRYDAAIYAIDLRLFGFEPAVFFDRWVTPQTTEWFAFFYYSYFVILLCSIVPIALFEKRTAILSEFSWGILWVTTVGHALYVVVPALGPHGLLAAHFEQPLVGRFWWPLVLAAVESVEGAIRTDIFPSMHTAAPTFLSLFAVRHRAHAPYRWAWPVVTFFTSQIIVATMFLRWHYLLDILAGLVLAVTGWLSARAIVPAEARARAASGCPPVWEPLFK